MSMLPVFALNTVVFPGSVTPLHIFEDRYRALIRDLLSSEDGTDRTFVIVAIREGYEVGEHGAQSVHRVGTLVQLTSVDAYDDGRYDIEVTGRQRARVVSHDASGEFLRGEIQVLADTDEPQGPAEAARTLSTFETYRTTLSQLRGAEVLAGQLPEDPAYLSYALAATCLLTLPQRQSLLEIDSAAQRLQRLRHFLHEEMRAMAALPSLPATEVARTRWSPN